MNPIAPLIQLGVNNPQMFCYAGAAFAGVNAGQELSNYHKFNNLPSESNISNEQDLSAIKYQVVLLKGELRGQDISDDLTRCVDGVRRCFQEVTITHSFNVERMERVQHVQRSNYPGILDRTYTNETRIERFSNTETSTRMSAMSLKIMLGDQPITISIARPKQETVIVADKDYYYLSHERDIHQASLRCNNQPRQEDSAYSVSEKYLEIGREVSVVGTLVLHRQTGRPDRYEIENPQLISIKTKDQLTREKGENSFLSVVVAAVCIGTAKFCCKNKPKKD